MATNQEEVIRCADDLTTLIDKQKKSGKTIYEYLTTDFLSDMAQEAGTKATVVLVGMGFAYTEYLMYYGSLSNPVLVQKMAFYAAVTVGSKTAVQFTSDVAGAGAAYLVISNLGTILKSIKVTVDEIKEVMKILNAPVEEFDNINDASGHVALQGINNDFPDIAMTMNTLNASGNKSESAVYKVNTLANTEVSTKVNTKAVISAFFKKLVIASDSKVYIDFRSQVNIDSDSVVTINGGMLSISGADSILSMKSAKLNIENRGKMTLFAGQLVNNGDAIEINGEDSSLKVSNGGKLINSDSCSIIIEGGPLDIGGETFTNNEHIMYVPELGIVVAISVDRDNIFELQLISAKGDVMKKIPLPLLMHEGCRGVIFGYKEDEIAFMYIYADKVICVKKDMNNAVIATYERSFSNVRTGIIGYRNDVLYWKVFCEVSDYSYELHSLNENDLNGDVISLPSLWDTPNGSTNFESWCVPLMRIKQFNHDIRHPGNFSGTQLSGEVINYELAAPPSSPNNVYKLRALSISNKKNTCINSGDPNDILDYGSAVFCLGKKTLYQGIPMFGVLQIKDLASKSDIKQIVCPGINSSIVEIDLRKFKSFGSPV